MKKNIELVKKFWLWFIKLSNKKDFLYGYPLFVLASVAVATSNILAFLSVVIWILVIIVNTDES